MIPREFATVAAVAIIFGFGIFLYWLTMLVDCAKNRFDPPVDKLFWLVLLLIVPVVGTIMYHIIVRSKRITSEKRNVPEKWVV